MARDMNPNKVKRSEVDEVFLTQADEILNRRHKAQGPQHLHPNQARRNVEKGEAIVKKAQDRKKKKDGK